MRRIGAGGAMGRVGGRRGRILRVTAAVVVCAAAPAIGFLSGAGPSLKSTTTTTTTMPHSFFPLPLRGSLQQDSSLDDHQQSRVRPRMATTTAGRPGNGAAVDDDEDGDDPLGAPSSTAPGVVTVVRRRGIAMPRNDAANLLDASIIPSTEAGRRHGVGRRAQGILPPVDSDGNMPPPAASTAVNGRDPRLAATYGEFPLASLDALLDVAEQWRLLARSTTTPGPSPGRTLVDLGSGCGRLCLYLALTRPPHHRVVGVELSPALHGEAIHAVDRALNGGWFKSVDAAETHSPVDEPQTLLELYQGPADMHVEVLQCADIVFAYCTTWDNDGFSPDSGGVVLSLEWRQLFAHACSRPGTIVVTTDRTLCDGSDNDVWKLLERLDVPNPEVGGSSTGYIHVRL